MTAQTHTGNGTAVVPTLACTLKESETPVGMPSRVVRTSNLTSPKAEFQRPDEHVPERGAAIGLRANQRTGAKVC
jgi:hypothetical protein